MKNHTIDIFFTCNKQFIAAQKLLAHRQYDKNYQKSLSNSLSPENLHRLLMSKCSIYKLIIKSIY